jgi:methylase of polypeptide subunit release factors
LVEWALRTPDDHVLDPAVGDGVFLVEAARHLRTYGGRRKGHQLHGVDVNPEAVAWTVGAITNILGNEDGPDIRLASFFDLDPPPGLLSDVPYMDAVVGNPPYIRYQSFAGVGRISGLARAAKQGVQLASLSSAWAPFVVHATGFLKQGGRLALVLPEEFIHASYARPVREFLRKNFRSTNVIRFENHRFPGAQERVVLLLAEGKDEAPAGELRLASLAHPEEVSGVQHVLAMAQRFAPHASPGKWDPDFDDPAAVLVDQLVASEYLVPLKTIGKAGIGYVSGANDFFVFHPSRARERKFPRRLLAPTVVAARQLPGIVLSHQDVRDMLARDEQCLLWTGDGAGHAAVDAYIAEGERNGIAGRYKCRVRDPWYVVPGACAPDAFLTYMSDEIPRLVLNRAGVTCSNTLLAIALKGVSPRVRPAFVAAFYNSATMVSAERQASRSRRQAIRRGKP